MELEEIKQKYKNGEIKSSKLEQVIYEEIYNKDESKIGESGLEAERIRAEILEEKTGVKLDAIKSCKVKTARLLQENVTTGIEEKIGGAIVPLGVAGPIKINGECANGEYYVPAATNEAALVAGLQRGFKAMNKAGGVKTVIKKDGMTRAPVIETPSISEAKKFVDYLKEKKLTEDINKNICQDSKFCDILRIEPYQLSNKVWLRLVFKTGDAMGMNTVTKYSAVIVKKLLEEFPNYKLIALSGNMCTDKKAAHINVLNGRGKSVETEIVISEEILKETFKEGVTAEKIAKINYVKNYLGSGLSGTMTGYNANVANTIAAVFAAAGQDLAQVVESSSCFTHAEVVDKGLRFGVTLPCLEVATVGGGTFFGTAKEALALMGCNKSGASADDNENVRRLAEITAAAVTSQELNLLAALAANYELAESHVKLAQGAKKLGGSNEEKKV